jgi:hypothetical protein
MGVQRGPAATHGADLGMNMETAWATSKCCCDLIRARSLVDGPGFLSWLPVVYCATICGLATLTMMRLFRLLSRARIRASTKNSTTSFIPVT